jgi:hypothetical protein
MEMNGVASDASFGRSRERVLPAAQRTALGKPGAMGAREPCVTWDVIICLHQAGQCCSQLADRHSSYLTYETPPLDM